MAEEKYCFDWYPGASGQLEVFGPNEVQGGQFRYTPPFRATLRPPLENCQMQASQDLDPIYAQLDKVSSWFNSSGARKAGGGPAAPPPDGAGQELQLLGQLLLTLVLPPRVCSELQTRDLYLEIGTDEALLDLPWELIFDGSDHLCANNFVGRFVNLSKPRITAQQRVAPVYGVELEELKMLVISVPEPQPLVKDGKTTEYRKLSGAKLETEAIVEAVAKIPYVELDVIEGATFIELFNKLQKNTYHIIHYNGHAVSPPPPPAGSKTAPDTKSGGLVLQDKLITTAQLSAFLGNHPPVFCFLNGCQTTRIAGSWKGQYSLYGLGSAILETGAYLLGSTWEIEDNTAAAFAKHFYECFLEGNSLGYATREARRAVRDPAHPDDLGWASYTLYGDPRLFVRAAVPQKIIASV